MYDFVTVGILDKSYSLQIILVFGHIITGVSVTYRLSVLPTLHTAPDNGQAQATDKSYRSALISIDITDTAKLSMTILSVVSCRMSGIRGFSLFLLKKILVCPH